MVSEVGQGTVSQMVRPHHGRNVKKSNQEIGLASVTEVASNSLNLVKSDFNTVQEVRALMNQSPLNTAVLGTNPLVYKL